ncbi:MAG: NAD-dependent epimerase/dehydratase family protein [Thermoleophilia bacterium]|nr:NAD-dependent epimerase/dehydratase family protein [Thermoleophilia bacterium]
MPTLVTGATGFLGRHLVPLLAGSGEPLRALVRPGTGADWLAGLGVELIRGELGDREALRRAAAGCGLVFHLAGVVAHERRDLPLLRAVNAEGVRAVLAAAELAARIVHVSSVAAIGPAPGPDRPVDESHPFPAFAERFVYARTKREGERLALEAAAAGRDVVVANPGFLLGPGDVYRVSTWPVARYLQGSLRVHETGGLSYVDVRDVAAALVTLAERGRAGERTILTCREGNLSHADFFRRVGDVTGVRRRMVGLPPRAAILAARVVPWPVRSGEVAAAAHWWFYDPAKAERELGLVTRPLDETIVDTAAQYR